MTIHVSAAQPGVAVSENKVKLAELAEGVVYVKGEIIVCSFVTDFPCVVADHQTGFGPLQRISRSCLYGYFGPAATFGR
jgi:hypothetical protein